MSRKKTAIILRNIVNQILGSRKNQAILFRIAASPKNIYFGCSFRDQGYHCSFDRSLLGNKDPEFKNPSVKISHFMHTNPEYASESIDASVNLNQIISLGCSFNP